MRVLNRGHMCRLHGICLLAVSIRVIRGINGICGINAIRIIRTTARSRPIRQRAWVVGQRIGQGRDCCAGRCLGRRAVQHRTGRRASHGAIRRAIHRAARILAVVPSTG